jgi:phage terminase small subunit
MMSKSNGKRNGKKPNGKKPVASERQKLFAREWVVDFNGTQAAIRAGYAEGSAHVTASRLLSDDKIQAEIAKEAEKAMRRVNLTQDRVLRELLAIAMADIREFISWTEDTVKMKPSSELTATQGAAISEVSQMITSKSSNLKFKLHSKERALELLGRHLALFIDRHEHVGSVEVIHKTDRDIRDEIYEELNIVVPAERQLEAVND